MDHQEQAHIELEEADREQRFAREVEGQFQTFMEQMMRNAVPQPRAGGGPNSTRTMKTSVEKLTHLKYFSTWDIRLDIAAQFSGCRQEIYGTGDANLDTNQGLKIADEDLDANRELIAKDLLTRSMDSSILALCNPKVNDAYTIYQTLYSVYRMDCEASREHDEIHLATLKLSDINPSTIQNLMKEINDTSEKLITSGIQVDDNKKLITLKRAVKQDVRFSATIASFRAMADLTFVKACSILMAVEREQRDEVKEEAEQEEKKEEININLQSQPNVQHQQQYQQYTICHRCDQPGHAHFNCPLRFQIQGYVNQLVQPQQYNGAAIGLLDRNARYGVATSAQQYQRGRGTRLRGGRTRFRGRGRFYQPFNQPPAIHTMIENNWVPFEYEDLPYVDETPGNENNTAEEEQDSNYVD